jgi:aminoglycoside phosphotransferase
MSTMGGLALARAKFALLAAGLDEHQHLERASSVTNEVWLGEDIAVRVNRRNDKRLWREARLGSHIPNETGYPEIVSYGTGTGFDYLVSRRRPGVVLARCWPTMSVAQRRRAVADFCFMMRTLHATPTPAWLPRVDCPQMLQWGSDPTLKLRAAVDELAKLEYVQRHLISEIRLFVETARPSIEPNDCETLIHGDLTFENFLWDGQHVSAMLDFEFCRPGAPDLDLDVLLRVAALPFLHVAEDYETKTLVEDYAAVPGWIAEEYPELFAHPDQGTRCRLYALAFEIRQCLLLPANAADPSMSEMHPMTRIQEILRGKHYLDRIPELARQF